MNATIEEQPRPDSPALHFLTGGGEVGALMRALDWSRTPLGPPARWPQSLKVTLRLLLTSRHPMFIFWGPELIQFYNDAYRQSLGPEKHPASLGGRGQDWWPESWSIVGPQIELVMSGRGATWHEEQRLPFVRHGQEQEVWWTYGYSPIDEPSAPNGVGGVLVICHEVTDRHQMAEALRRSESETRRLNAELERRAASAALRGERAEEALAQQQRLYEAILTNTPDLAYVFDLDHRFIYANEGLLKMWGKSRQEAIGRNCLELGYEPWHAAMHDREIEQVIATKLPVRGEVPFAGTFGRRIYDYLFVPVLNAAGEVEAVAGTTRDVTEYRRTEEALLDREQHLRRLLDNLFAFVGVLDLAGTLLEANRAPLDLAGIGRSDVIGRPFWDCYWWSFDAQVQQQIRRAVERAARGEIVRCDMPVRIAGGEFITIDFQLAPLRDDHGRITHLIPSGVDITERRRIEQALRESEERLQLALTAGQSGVWHWDIVKDVATVSSSYRDIYGLAADEPVNYERWLAAVHPDDRAMARRYGEEFFRSGTDWRLEYRIIHPERGERWLGAIGRLERDATGRPARFVGVNFELTDQKRAEQALREADRRKDEFLATLAHELRNPLAPIRNAVHLLKLNSSPEPQAHAAREIIDRQVQHMVRLVDDLLEVSRITLGQINLQHEQLDLADVVTDALESSRFLIEAEDHRLEVHLPAEPIFLTGDRIRLAQVIQNLLNNAAKYTPGGGQITVRAERREDAAVVTVRDTGVGVPPEMQSRIFELFTRSHPSDRIKASGLGIGLALSKRLIELHGGRIEVESGGAGTGSEFRVCLPIIGAAATDVPPAAGEQPAREAKSKRRVLVVDDLPDAAESLAMLLQLSGHTVEVALDGPRALAALERFAPEVVLLDIGMPGMDGYEVARRMRASARGSDLLLVALSGWGQAEDKRRALEAGFDQHLIKPVDPALLTMVLDAERSAAS